MMERKDDAFNEDDADRLASVTTEGLRILARYFSQIRKNPDLEGLKVNRFAVIKDEMLCC